MKKNILTRGAFVALLLTNTMAMAESDYPATNFKPVIVFQDQDANESSKKNESAATTKNKNVSSAEATKSEPSSKAKISEEDSSDSVAAKPAKVTKDEKSNTNVIIGLGVIAAAGAFFFTRKKSTASGKGAGSARGANGLTGVERYLQSRRVTAGTGVARYLDKKASALKEKAESTGVSKYLKEKSQSQRVVASSEVSPRGTVGGATGVAKYLRDKG